MRFRSLAALASAAVLAVLAMALPASAVAKSDVLVIRGCYESVDPYLSALRADPTIGVVSEMNGSAETPTAEQLAANDLVVSANSCGNQNRVAYGDRLADYIDGGGHVLQFAYDNCSCGGNQSAGTFRERRLRAVRRRPQHQLRSVAWHLRRDPPADAGR